MFENHLWVFDGAIGTELYERGFYINRPFEELNLSHPSDVQAVHEAYIAAGAECLTTNTFSVTRPQLKKFDIADKQSALIQAGLEIANRAREKKPEVKIGFSLGPTGVPIEPLGPTSHESAQEFFSEAVRCAHKSQYDFYILETFSNLAELEDAIIGIRKVDALRPILASVTAHSSQSDFIPDFVKRIGERADVQALGLNCSQGPSDLLTLLKRMRPLTTKPIIIQPNAGVPNHVNGRYFYMTSPDYLGKYAKRFIEAGAQGVGGCCGTGPLHIQAVRAALHMESARVLKGAQFSHITLVSSPTKPPSPDWEKRSQSHIGELLRSGKKVHSVELLPPKGTDVEKFLKQLDQLEAAGIPLANVPDGARASTRISSLHLAALANRSSRKLRVFPHLTTRDRNLIALQSDLLGAFVNGVKDVLVITGDPPKLGNNRDATAVYDIDSIGLTYLMDCLNRGQSPSGDSLGQGTGFGIGVASNPTAVNMELELKRFRYKCESGADFAVSQPIFDPESFFRWREALKDSWRPHLVGIWPLISMRNAEFLANEVPGILVPKNILEEMAKAENDPVEATKRGIDIAQRNMAALSSSCEGFCVSAPLGKVDVALKVFE